MLDLHAALAALGAMLLLAAIAWPISVVRRDASIVDSLWSLFFLLGATIYAASVVGHELSPRAILTGALLAVWGLRLCGYITWRNWDEGEDRRYQEIRARNQPHFAWKSFYLVFMLQAALAWVIAMPVFVALTGSNPLNGWDLAGVAFWGAGFACEAIGDWQLARFKTDSSNNGRVLDTGLWKYTRHPNYFGEATLWWGFFLLAVAAGAWWTVFAPLVMTFMLLKVSGVALLEKNIGERRPAYRDYVRRTSAFVPLPPRNPDPPQHGAST